jgi:hypothetical protein
MEGDLGGLGHLDRLLEQAAPGVDRAAAKQRPSGERQDVDVRGRTLKPSASAPPTSAALAAATAWLADR